MSPTKPAPFPSWSARRILLLALLLLNGGLGRAQELTQTLVLRPGWNSIWLEVAPTNASPAVVFAGLPLSSAWTWSERVSATDFIQNPEVTGWNRAAWLAYFPAGSEEARLGNLHGILPQRAYLLRLKGTNEVTWTVTGRPVLNMPGWAPNKFNLRGFPVDPAVAPTFREFFQPSAAHYAVETGKLESIYRLDARGEWSRVLPEERMERGAAYWVYTRGASDYVAPFRLQLSSGDGFAFDGGLKRIEVKFINAHSASKSVRLQPEGPNASPLLLLPAAASAPTNGAKPLVTHDQSLAANALESIRVGLDRAQLTNSPATDPATGKHATLLRASDGQGTLFFVSVTAQVNTAPDYAGLWVGTVMITNVDSTLGGAGTTAQSPVTQPFPLRLLLHVDDAGLVNLLRDVVIVTVRTNAIGVTSPSTQLVTDPIRLGAYAASDIRDGTVRGRRLTSPHFDFTRAQGQSVFPLEGTLGPGNLLSGTLPTAPDDPGNPFLHRYHPDHGTNAYTISRAVQFQLDAQTTDATSDLVTGTYVETITGLHKLPLRTAGSLELHRVSTMGALNTEIP